MESIKEFLGNEKYFHLMILAILLFIVYLIYTNINTQKCSCNHKVEHFLDEINSSNNLNEKAQVHQDSSKLCSEIALSNGMFNYTVNKIDRGNRPI